MRTIRCAACLLPVALLAVTARASGSYPACTTQTFSALAAGSGCEQGDKIFSQFSYDVNSGTPPAESAINVAFSGTAPAGPISYTYTSSSWTDVASPNSVFLFNYTQVDQTLDPGYVITALALNPGSVSFGTPAAGDGAQVIIHICTNEDNNDCVFGDSNYGQIAWGDQFSGGIAESYCYSTCSSGSTSGSLTIDFAASLDITSIFLEEEVIINQTSGTVTFGGASTDYYESPTPEPGTLGLLAAGLGGIGLLLGRKSKAALAPQ